jgi:hypothetical protein
MRDFAKDWKRWTKGERAAFHLVVAGMCDAFNARWRNQLVAMPTEVSLGEVAGWYGLVATTASNTRTVTDRRAVPALSALHRLGLGLYQGLG